MCWVSWNISRISIIHVYIVIELKIDVQISQNGDQKRECNDPFK